MTALLISFLAACFSSLANLFFRKSSGQSTTTNLNGYLAIYFFLSFIFSLILCHKILETQVNFLVIGMGSCVGLLNITLMLLTAQALMRGPAGLTFAFQNTSSIFPGMLLFLLLGTNFGFTYTYIQFLGILLVVTGLYLGTKTEQNQSQTKSGGWFKYAIGGLAIQVLALSSIQARCVFFNCDALYGFPSMLAVSPEEDIWFMPAQFGTALILQLGICLWKKSLPQKTEMIFGSLAGISNAVSTYLLLIATQEALPSEKAILFPCFAVSNIVLCNAWAYKLYKEKFNVAANAASTVGVFLGASG